MAVSRVVGGAGFCNTGVGFGGNISSSLTAGTGTKPFTYTAAAIGNAVLIWVAMAPTSTSPTTVSLSATGWVFTQVGGILNGGATAGCSAIFSAYAPSTATATITVVWNQTATFINNLIDEFSGVDPATATAGNNFATGTGTPTVSVTPTADNCMIWVPCNDTITGVGSIGGTAATKGSDDTQQDWSEYRLLSGGSGASQSCTVTGSGSYIIAAVAVKPNDPPVIGSVPSGTALTTPAFTAKYLFFDTGDYGIGV